jgi:hypothetical protein
MDVATLDIGAGGLGITLKSKGEKLRNAVSGIVRKKVGKARTGDGQLPMATDNPRYAVASAVSGIRGFSG